MTGMQERVNRDGITATSEWSERPPANAWDGAANWYRVTLHNGEQTLTVPFGMGSGHTDEPEAAEVINCLVSDAATYENARSFEEWADELGFDEDSRKALTTWRQVAKQTAALRDFLGAEYDAYLWDTEGL